MNLFAFLLRQSPRTVVLAVLAGVVSGLCHTALLALINRALHQGPPGALLWGFGALMLVLPLTRIASTYVLTLLAQVSVQRLRLTLAANILGTPLDRLEALGQHRLLTALTDDASAIVSTLRMLPATLADAAIVAGGLTYLAILSLPAFLIFLGLLAVGVVTYQLPLARGMVYQRRVRDEAEQVWVDLRGVIDGVKELKVHSGRRGALLARLDATGDRARRLNLRSVLYFQAAAGWGQVLVFGTIGLILFALPGRAPLDPQALTGYVLVILYLTGPIEGLMNSLPSVNAARIALERVAELGGVLEREAVEGPPLLLAPAGAGRSVELAGVVHRYPGAPGESPFTLGPLDLRVEPGELLFVTGGNGSGKTTLAKVLTGLYAPHQGEVRLDGRPVTDAGRAAYRDQFSVVFADFHLFDSLLGLDPAGLDDRAREYLRTLKLDGKVTVEDGRFSTTALSRGQQKRLALLTAYLEDRPVNVFDEWAADQDPAFKEFFYRRLLPELAARGKAVVVITHDDRYFDAAHRLVKLDYGCIVPVAAPAPAGVPAMAAAAPAGAD